MRWIQQVILFVREQFGRNCKHSTAAGSNPFRPDPFGLIGRRRSTPSQRQESFFQLLG
jgi:hypothetical protein